MALCLEEVNMQFVNDFLDKFSTDSRSCNV